MSLPDFSAPLGVAERRRLLIVGPDPMPARDYLITLQRPLGASRLRVRYVPDRLILAEPSLDGYLASLADHLSGSPEALAGAVLDDLANELVPRWLEVTLGRDSAAGDIMHRVTLVDSQPGWEPSGLRFLL